MRCAPLALLVVATLGQAAVPPEIEADARAALMVEGSLHPLAGRIRLAAALRACDNFPLAAAIDVPGLDRRRLVREALAEVEASPRRVAPEIKRLSPAQREEIVVAASIDLAAYQVGYMNGITAWKATNPTICSSFAAQASSMR